MSFFTDESLLTPKPRNTTPPTPVVDMARALEIQRRRDASILKMEAKLPISNKTRAGKSRLERVNERIAAWKPPSEEVPYAKMAAYILRDVARLANIPLADLKGNGRAKILIHARQWAMWRLRTECGLSYPIIGRLLKKDHSSAHHGVRAHAKRFGLPLPEGAA